jgi:dolichol-phosphate mannosyltransferase
MEICYHILSMIVYTRKKIRRLLTIDFIRFCIVGGTGFAINFLILMLLHKSLSIPIYIAQFIGAEVALFSNFLLHHHWTYKNNKVQKSFRTLLFQFHVTSWPAIVGSTLMVSMGVKVLHMSSIYALTISSAIALMWNFAWSKYVIWRDVPSTRVEEIVT